MHITISSLLVFDVLCLVFLFVFASVSAALKRLSGYQPYRSSRAIRVPEPRPYTTEPGWFLFFDFLLATLAVALDRLRTAGGGFESRVCRL